MKDSESMAKARVLGTVAAKTKNASRAREELNVTFRTWRKFSMLKDEASLVDLQSRKKRSDCLSSTLTRTVHNFFAGHSFPLPSKRYASRSVLTDTTKCLHKSFLAENEELCVSFSAFKKLRPAEMMTVDKMKFVGCVCEYCINVEYAVSLILELLVP
jgi:hypothetical protein